VAEVFGKSNKSRIIDLQMNNDSIYTPGYAIYDNDILSRLALINYITDPSGNSDYTATFSFDVINGQSPTQAKVKCGILIDFKQGTHTDSISGILLPLLSATSRI
jgi:hypothetical protein